MSAPQRRQRPRRKKVVFSYQNTSTNIFMIQKEYIHG
nr:MAG TPA: hypothetical protein [Caudoviricetes sp.]